MLILVFLYVDFLTNRMIECNFLRHEREYRLVHGGWICLRTSGLHASGARFGPLQCLLYKLLGPH